jgi:hypothetical protein
MSRPNGECAFCKKPIQFNEVCVPRDGKLFCENGRCFNDWKRKKHADLRAASRAADEKIRRQRAIRRGSVEDEMGKRIGDLLRPK